METLLQLLMKPGTHCQIHFRSNNFVEGCIKRKNDGTLCLIDNSGYEVNITPQQIEEIEAIGLLPPLKSETKIIPVMVAPNGFIRECSGRSGQVSVRSTNGSVRLMRFDYQALQGTELQEKAQTGELKDTEVFCAEGSIGTDKMLKTPCIFLPQSLDSLLDEAIRLAREGQIENAQALTTVIKTQYESDAEVSRIHQIISALHQKYMTLSHVDFYSSIPTRGDELAAMGRILDFNGRVGHVVDWRSRQTIYFSNANFLSEGVEPIKGMPVLYVPILNNNNNYEARCVVETCDENDLLNLIEDEYDQRRKLNAWGLVQILLAKAPDNMDAQMWDDDLSDAGNKNWNVTLPFNSKAQAQMVEELDVPPLEVKLERLVTHEQKKEEQIENKQFVTLNINVPEEGIPQQSSSSITSTLRETASLANTLQPTTNAQPSSPNNQQAAHAFNNKRINQDDLGKIIGIQPIPQSMRNTGLMLRPTHRIYVRRGDICFIDNESGNPTEYPSFKLVDIVDPELLEQTDEYRRDNDLRGVEIVCQLDEGKKKAWSVMLPISVQAAMQIARNLMEETTEKGLPQKELRRRLRNILGIAEIIVTQHPMDCEEAMALLSQVNNALNSLSSQSSETDGEKQINSRGTIKELAKKVIRGGKEHENSGAIYDHQSKRGLTYINSAVLGGMVPEVGKEVSYSVRNYNGVTIAWCIHEPMPNDDLLNFAIAHHDSLYDSRHTQWSKYVSCCIEAWGLVMQVLDVEPYNAEAEALRLQYEKEIAEHNCVLPSLIRLRGKDEEKEEKKEEKMLSLAKAKQFADAIKNGIELVANLETEVEELRNRIELIKGNNEEGVAKERVELDTRLFYAIGKKEDCICRMNKYYQALLRDETDTVRMAMLKEEYTEFGKQYLKKLNQELIRNLQAIEEYFISLGLTNINDYTEVLEHLARAYQRSRKQESFLALPEIYARLSLFYLNKKDERKAWNYWKSADTSDQDGFCIEVRKIEAVLNYRSALGTIGSQGHYLGEDKVAMTELKLPIPSYGKDDEIWGLDESQDSGGFMSVERKFYTALSSVQGKRDNKKVIACFSECLTALGIVLERNIGINDPNLQRQYGLADKLELCRQNGTQWPFWRFILQACLVNANVARVFVNFMFDLNPSFAFDLLWTWGGKMTGALDKKNYGLGFENLRRSLSENYKRWADKATGFSASSNQLVEIGNYLRGDQKEFETISKWMPDADVLSINNMRSDLPDLIDRYLGAESSGVRFHCYQMLDENLKTKLREIASAPTLLSMSSFRPILKLLRQSLERHYRQTVQNAPAPCLRLLTVSAVNKKTNHVLVQLELTNNESWARPMHSHSIDLLSPVFEVTAHLDDDSYVFGDEHKVFALDIGVGTFEGTAPMKVVYCYRANGMTTTPIEQDFEVDIKRDFEKLPNPYAKSGQWCEDINMFVGRNTLISKMADKMAGTTASQFLLYGQKRSGKTSVLKHLYNKILKTNLPLEVPKVICAQASFLSVTTIDDAYHKILEAIEREITRMQEEYEDLCDNNHLPLDTITWPEIHTPSLLEFKQLPNGAIGNFMTCMREIKRNIEHTPGWEQSRLIVFIDEFTTIHRRIKEGTIDPGFIYAWKEIQEQTDTRFTSFLIGQDVMPLLAREYPNIYTSHNSVRLSYLEPEDARELIERPMKEQAGVVYLNDAAERVYHYTSGNPYYIWKFCSQLIDHLNKICSTTITINDVEDTAAFLTESKDGLKEIDFDNLVLEGESESVSEFSKSKVTNVLRRIACESKHSGYCPRTLIHFYNELDDEVDDILNRLVAREVLTKTGHNQYGINVQLFSKWLWTH